MTDRIYTSFLRKESVRLVKLSLTWIRYFYRYNEFCATSRISRPLSASEQRILSAAANHEPEQAGDQIGEVDKRQLAIRPFGDGVEISD